MRRLQVDIKVRLGGPLFRNPDHARVSHVCRNTIPFAAVLLSRCGHYRLGCFRISWRALCTELNPNNHTDGTHSDPQIFRLTRRKNIVFETVLYSRQPRFRQRKSQACLLFYNALPNLGRHRRTKIKTSLIHIEWGVTATLTGAKPLAQGKEHCRQACHPNIPRESG